MPKRWSAIKKLMYETGQTGSYYMLLIEPNGNIISYNARTGKKFNFSGDENEELNFYGLVHPNKWKPLANGIKKAAVTKNPVSVELMVRNGVYHPVKWLFNYVSSETGNDYLLCSGSDSVGEINFISHYKADYNAECSHTRGMIIYNVAEDKITNETFDNKIATKNALNSIQDVDVLAKTLNPVRGEKGNVLRYEQMPFVLAAKNGIRQSAILVFADEESKHQWLHLLSTPVFDTTGKEVVQVITVVTNAINSNNKMPFEAEVYKNLIDHNPALIWSADEGGMVQYVNNTFISFFHLDGTNIESKFFSDFLPDATANIFSTIATKVRLLKQTVVTTETISLCEQNQSKLLIAAFPIETNNNSTISCFQAFDVTELISESKLAKEANDRLLFLSRATNNAIWEWDMLKGETFRNDALIDMVGYQPEQSSGIAWWLKRIHPDDRQRVENNIERCTKEGLLSWEDEYLFKCADGNYKHVRDRGFIMYDNGVPVKMIGSLDDISGLKELEEQLMHEKFKTQREISETVFRTQENERAAIGRELHDNVNQLLATSGMFVKMLTVNNDQEKEIKEKSFEYIQTAIEEIRKISKDLVIPKLKQDGLISSVNVLLEDLKLAIGINIRFTHDAEIDMLSSGKKVALFRIVQEQFKNITKYSKAENVDVVLRKVLDDVLLVIKDDGVGFDTKTTSNGVGMFSINERVKFYSGKTEVESSPGNGCTIKVYLPFANTVLI